MLRIGRLEFDFPVVQAALAGYSDAPMRIVARRLGAPYALREVILDRTVVVRGRKQRRLLQPTLPEDRPLGVQLMGAQPREFAAAAARLTECGCDVVDINFGCPVKKVLGRCRGGYLLSDPATAIEILRAVRASVPPAMPVTVKMRRGTDDSPASESSFFRIFDAAFELGVAAITVHGRTVRQRYVGPSSWEFLARVKKHAGHRTVLGSGDLFSAGDIRRMLTETGVDGVTVARGCIGNPWIFREARAVLSGRPLPEPPAVPEQGAVIRAHFELAVAEHGERQAVRILRKFGIKYAELHPCAAEVRRAFIGALSRDAWLRVLDEWYDPRRAWPPGRRRLGPGHLIAAGAIE